MWLMGVGLGVGLDEHRAHRHHVLIPDLSPIHRERALGEPAGKNLGGAVEGALQATPPDGGRLAGEVHGGRVAVEAIRNDDDGHLLGR